jgi:hypothetical protein
MKISGEVLIWLMSYNYFISAFTNQESPQIATEKLLAIVDQYMVNRDENAIDLIFGKDERCTLFINSFVPGFDGMMTDACDHELFLRCLYDIMQLGNFVFYEPNGKAMIILSPEVEAHLPESMIETMGQPLVADDFESFKTLFYNNR